MEYTLEQGRDQIKCMPLGVRFCEEDLNEIFSQEEKE